MTPMIRAVLLLVVTIAFALTPAITPPVEGYDPALFPVQITRPMIQPAGYAFAIWGGDFCLADHACRVRRLAEA